MKYKYAETLDRGMRRLLRFFLIFEVFYVLGMFSMTFLNVPSRRTPEILWGAVYGQFPIDLAFYESMSVVFSGVFIFYFVLWVFHPQIQWGVTTVFDFFTELHKWANDLDGESVSGESISQETPNAPDQPHLPKSV